MFVHLHIHSYYSFLDSTLAIAEIVEAACRAKMDAVALTDTNGLYAAVPFVRACRKAGLRPILGAEIDLGSETWEAGGGKREEEGKKQKTENGKRTSPGRDFLHPSSFLLHPFDGLRAVVLARDRSGYAELSRLVTQRRLLEPPPLDDPDAPSDAETDQHSALHIPHSAFDFIPHSALRIPHSSHSALRIPHSSHSALRIPHSSHSALRIPHSEMPGPPFEGSLLDGLLRLSEEHVWILTDSPALLCLLAGRRNVFAELILTSRRRGLCRRLYDLATERHVPMVATGDVHFAHRDDYALYRLLRAIATQKTIETLEDGAEVGSGRREAGEEVSGQKLEAGEEPLSSVSRLLPFGHHFCFADAEHYFKTADEMAHTFRGLRSALRNTHYIAERCEVEWTNDGSPLLGEWKFPRVRLPPGETAFSHLWKTTFDGLKQRYRPLTPEATRRLEYELEVIARLGFSEYFLAVNEIADEARRRGFAFLGRGSAANSIVSFALGLTPVDPIRHNLYFERFLNPERRSPPDIDLDFSWKERDAVVRWIFDRFGHDRVALIATHITLQPRQAIREAGKAMGLTEAEVNRFTRPIPGWLGEGQCLGDLPKVFPECRHLPVGDEPWKTILARAQRLIGFPRHLSIHCGGLLITPEPITDYTPLQRAAKGPIITQMEMHAIEDLGLIKMDILSNRSLGVLSDCLRMVRQHGRRESEEESALPARK